MQPLSISQLYERYKQLRSQLERREISHPQFVNLVQQLQAHDQNGKWWTIDPQTGRYLTYAASGWISATPPAARPSSPQPKPAAGRGAPRAAPAKAKSGGGLRGCLSSPLVVGILSFGTAGVWLIYTSIRGSREGYDLLTPLVIGGVPFLVRLLQKPLDKLLSPIYKILGIVPRPLLAGAALAAPLVLGVVFAGSASRSFGALQRSIIVSVFLGYVLTRRPPEVAR